MLFSTFRNCRYLNYNNSTLTCAHNFTFLSQRLKTIIDHMSRLDKCILLEVSNEGLFNISVQTDSVHCTTSMGGDQLAYDGFEDVVIDSVSEDTNEGEPESVFKRCCRVKLEAKLFLKALTCVNLNFEFAYCCIVENSMMVVYGASFISMLMQQKIKSELLFNNLIFWQSFFQKTQGSAYFMSLFARMRMSSKWKTPMQDQILGYPQM